jgi:hypothetical protein
MDMLLSFFGSIAEPARLALLGSSLIVGALLLRKLLLPGHNNLNDATKADAHRGTT